METARNQALSIGRVSARTGCKVETIRYYERVGLIESPARTAGGYRQYQREHVDRIAFIRRCRELGFSLLQIEALLAISSDAANHTRAEVKQLVNEHIDDIHRKISDLQNLAGALQELGRHCDGAQATARDCPILDALSRFSATD
ncbi:MAG: helix-turn-helix domain-containing protein [Gammaproteobacteria bacterium]|nr:helix-turn-helix domain-containing protein [Gammaproteobacteria bacterium]